MAGLGITTTHDLLTELDSGVLTITLNRPDKLNSLTVELTDALTAAFAEASENDAVRAVVLTGSGRAFCAGAALGDDPAELDVRAALRDHYNPTALALFELDKPVVAAIRGIAGGAGAALALGCDLRIASDDAKLALLFCRIGVALDMGASYYLPRIVGAGRAAELALFGDDVRAQEALAIGLVNKVVPGERLEAAASEVAERLARGPFALIQTKRQLRTSFSNTLPDQLQLEYETQGLASDSQDMIEGINAFLERRDAHFTGR
jgi:2-(1,2-epoxy-1,2-dihydrophenyl)acetyl-CoA isomerase